ncbi:MAG: hypothetical protein QOJ02_1203 [Acidobacteriota bacterium]|nr:hypothetical protein [Acidobacteriota bacterium]
MNLNTRTGSSLFQGGTIIQCLLACCLILIGGSLSVGQQPGQNDARHARQRAEALLSKLPDQIKLMDEPTMRVFLRLRIVKFLWDNKLENLSDTTEEMAAEALADIQKYEKEIPELYESSFRSELLALLQLHAPALAARLTERYGLNETHIQADTAHQLLYTKDGMKRAVEMMREIIRTGQLPPNIEFFLSDLEDAQPAETISLLADLLTIEERRPGTISWENIFLLKHFYISKNAPPELQARFLTLLINKSSRLSILPQQDRTVAYRLLAATLPKIQELLPNLYSLAASQMSSLGASAPKFTLEREDVTKRIEQSNDELAQMIAEAEATKDSSLKERLLVEASQLALKKGQLKVAIDLVMKVESEDSHHLLWRDQFLGDVIQQAIKEADLIVADYGVSKIRSPLKRASIMQIFAAHFFKLNDLVSARERLSNAVKLIESAENNADKAVAFLKTIPLFIKVDNQRALEVAQAAVKVINNIPGPNPEDKPGSAARSDYISKTMMPIAWHLIPAFRSLAETDSLGTFSLADSIMRREIKASANFGASIGIRAADEGTSLGQSN